MIRASVELKIFTMCKLFNLFLCVVVLVCQSDAARILAYYPTPSISHQLPFRPLTLELVKRGHEVTVITTDPIFPKGEAPENLKEIDLHDLSYTLWKEKVAEFQNKLADPNNMSLMLKVVASLIEEQLKSQEVQAIINEKNKRYDLFIIEAFLDAALGLTHAIEAPVIQFSSLGGNINTHTIFGGASHPILYPTAFRHKIFNLTKTEKLSELYNIEYQFAKLLNQADEEFERSLQRVFGPSMPSLEELRKKIDMIFVNVHPMWDSNRPVPPNFIYVGGIHSSPSKELPKDLQTYLDSSKNGVIYVSFGSNVDPTLFSESTVRTFVNVFSKLPYDVLWKWNKDELPGRTENIKISKWLPQPDLLKHPKVKLFITQGGLQSTDEAIIAEVPLLGMPVFGDQFYNVELYKYHGIGLQVDLGTVTEEKLTEGINTIVQDDSYRKNIKRLREVMHDQPQKPLERAVWWTEYVIRHSGAGHLRAPSANMSYVEYLELELVTYVVLAVLGALTLVYSVTYFLFIKLFGVSKKVKKN